MPSSSRARQPGVARRPGRSSRWRPPAAGVPASGNAPRAGGSVGRTPGAAPTPSRAYRRPAAPASRRTCRRPPRAWRIMLDVIDRLAPGATATPGETADDLLLGHVEADHMIEAGRARLCEDPVQRFGLGHRPGEAVEDIPSRALRARQFFPDDSDDHLIRHKLARVHIALRLQPERRAMLDGLPQDLSRGDVG